MYVGEFKDDKLCGPSAKTFAIRNNVYTGEFKDGEMHGMVQTQ